MIATFVMRIIDALHHRGYVVPIEVRRRNRQRTERRWWGEWTPQLASSIFAQLEANVQYRGLLR